MQKQISKVRENILLIGAINFNLKILINENLQISRSEICYIATIKCKLQKFRMRIRLLLLNYFF